MGYSPRPAPPEPARRVTLNGWDDFEQWALDTETTLTFYEWVEFQRTRPAYPPMPPLRMVRY